jgi:ribosomal protein S18 acetylase RimI-like enzyme
MIKLINLQYPDQLLQLLTVQRAAYLVEAQLIDFYDIPTLHETQEQLQHSDEIFYGYFIDRQLAGAVSYKLADDVLDIYRLVVDPGYFRQGIAKKLLNFVENQVAKTTPHIKKIIVSTGAKNFPAKNFYRQVGFVELGDKEIVAGLLITLFEKSF